MTAAREIAFDLLRRVLAGERGELPLHLGMLLEKSSPLNHGDKHYQQVLPPELVQIKLAPETIQEIVTSLCAEVLQNPEQALIFIISFSPTDQALKTAVQVLIKPPRKLKMDEYATALSLLRNLPWVVAQNPNLLSKAELDRVIEVAEKLERTPETGVGVERSARIGVRHLALEFLKSVRIAGI